MSPPLESRLNTNPECGLDSVPTPAPSYTRSVCVHQIRVRTYTISIEAPSPMRCSVLDRLCIHTQSRRCRCKVGIFNVPSRAVKCYNATHGPS